jgi:hypothetical protein
VEIAGRSVRRIRGFKNALVERVLEKFPKTIFFANDDLAAGTLFECQKRSI